jgi:hypothetical protein
MNLRSLEQIFRLGNATRTWSVDRFLPRAERSKKVLGPFIGRIKNDMPAHATDQYVMMIVRKTTSNHRRKYKRQGIRPAEGGREMDASRVFCRPCRGGNYPAHFPVAALVPRLPPATLCCASGALHRCYFFGSMYTTSPLRDMPRSSRAMRSMA